MWLQWTSLSATAGGASTQVRVAWCWAPGTAAPGCPPRGPSPRVKLFPGSPPTWHPVFTYKRTPQRVKQETKHMIFPPTQFNRVFGRFEGCLLFGVMSFSERTNSRLANPPSPKTSSGHLGSADADRFSSPPNQQPTSDPWM